MRRLSALLVLGAATLTGCGGGPHYVHARDGVLRVKLDEYRLRPEYLQVRAGRVRLQAVNTGRLTHNLTVESFEHEEGEEPHLYGRTDTLHPGQREAALAAGLTPLLALQAVILPQVLRFTLPALGNYTTQLIKDTAIASAIAAPEIMFHARNLVTSTFQTPLIYACAILLYASVIYPVNWAFAGLERRLGAGR